MANELVLMAEPREIHGKKVKALRREGLVPGVVYGPVVEGTVSVSVNGREFYKFYMSHGHSTIFTLKWDGGSQPVLIREVQVDPVRQDILHIDFFAPNMKVKLRQNVAITLLGHPEVPGGMLQQAMNEIEVEALPANLPSDITLDVSGLANIGDTVTVADIEAIADVEFITDSEVVIASIVAEAVQEEPEVEEEDEDAEGEEAAEGEESEDGEAAEGDDAE